MSTRKGSVNRAGPPKHQNRTTFKNNMHDTSKQTKMINSLEVTGVCSRCKEVIEWKIKYKKYKPLTVPKKCVRCGERTIKKAYYVACEPCCAKNGVCAKCNQAEDIVQKHGLTPQEEAHQQSLLEQELKFMPERKRRTFKRLQESSKLEKAAALDGEEDDDEGRGSDVGDNNGEKDTDTMDGEDGLELGGKSDLGS